MMFNYLLQRFLQSLLLLLGVLFLVFWMVRLTGDPADLMVSREATREQREAFREAYGLNRPLYQQFTDFMGKTLRGDLGLSMRKSLPNQQLILERLPATLELALSSLALAILISLPLGVAAGMNPGGFFDGVSRALGLAGQTIPSFVLAIILILFFAVELRWLPSFGRDGFRSLILPALALGFAGMGQFVRLTRTAVLEVRNEDYIRTARAKGLERLRIAFKHLLPNAAVPLISVLGVQFTYLLGGSVYIETIFAYPGLGSLLNDAIRDSDFPLVQAITLFIALFAIGMSLLTDILYAWINPRMRQA
jgi:ABC-type dipeptide/oligopeptide/nickel transport system permease component